MGRDVISDRADPAVQRIIDVAKPARGAAKTILIEDVEPLTQAVRSGVEVIEVYGLESAALPDELTASCDVHGIPIRLLASAVANQIFRTEKRPRVFGVARTPRRTPLAALADLRGDVVVLDGVKIVGNIGAIVRTAFALGASGVVLVDSDLATVYDRRLVRASRGYVFSMPVVLATRAEVVAFVEGAALPVAALDAHGAVTMSELGTTTERFALTFGAEKTGGSDELAGLVSHTVSIPMTLAAESLNVSVAAGVALYARSVRNLGR